MNDWVWSAGGKIMTGENWSTGQNSVPVPMSTTNPTRSDLGSNAGLRRERPATDRPSGLKLIEITYEDSARTAQ